MKFNLVNKMESIKSNIITVERAAQIKAYAPTAAALGASVIIGVVVTAISNRNVMKPTSSYRQEDGQLVVRYD